MTFLERIAVALMGGSWVVTAGILLVPFVDMEYNRVAVAAGIYFFTQVMYWTGFAIGGRELARRYRHRFPWLSWLSWTHWLGKKD